MGLAVVFISNILTCIRLFLSLFIKKNSGRQGDQKAAILVLDIFFIFFTALTIQDN